MYLHVKLPDNLRAESLIKQKKIPCFCRIGKEFEVIFQKPLPEAVGLVSEWDRKQIDQHVPAGAGGQYTHYAFGMITIEKYQPSIYRIIDLFIFDYNVGWCAVYINGQYSIERAWEEENEERLFSEKKK